MAPKTIVDERNPTWAREAYRASLTRMSLSELLLIGQLSPEIGSRGNLRDGVSAREMDAAPGAQDFG
jgi:hypothetical protein